MNLTVNQGYVGSSPTSGAMKKKEKEELRKTYLENRSEQIDFFNSSLQEVQLDKPSVSGKIAGMDFQQFSALTVFNTILEQEEYTRSKAPYVIPEEEKVILANMVEQAKKVFGDEYSEWYSHCKKSRR